MSKFFKKQGTMRIIVMVVALLLVVGLIGGMVAMSKTSSSTSPAKSVVTSTTTSTNSGSTNQGGSINQGGSSGQGESMQEETLGTLSISFDSADNEFVVYHNPVGYDRDEDVTLSGSGSYTLNFSDATYYMYVDGSGNITASFTGYYEETYYDNVSISVESAEDNTATVRYFLCDPYKGYHYWDFSEGDSGTLTISVTSNGH